VFFLGVGLSVSDPGQRVPGGWSLHLARGFLRLYNLAPCHRARILWEEGLTSTGVGRHFRPLFHFAMQPTYRPHNKKRARKIGFRARMATRGGRQVIASRRKKGRKRLTLV